MISVNNLEYTTLIELVRDLLNQEKDLSLNFHDDSRSFLSQGFGASVGKRIISEVKYPDISTFDLLNEGINRSNAYLNRFDLQEFIIVIPQFINEKTKDDFENRIDQIHRNKVKIIDLKDLERLLLKFPEIEKKYRIEISTWFEAYSHIAELLNEFYLIHGQKAPEELYKKLEKSSYSEANTSRLFNPKLQLAEKGLDPIQIFASFNYSRIYDTTRMSIINDLLKILGSKKHLESKIDFRGIPAVIITSVIQFRGWEAQQSIWESFSSVVEKGLNGLNSKDFTSLKKWRGIEIPSYSIFLFWVNSEEFLPLDKNTVSFLKTIEVARHRPRSYSEYFDLCTEKNKLINTSLRHDTKNVFRNIVKEAYEYYEDNEGSFSLSGLTETLISEVTGIREEKDVLVEKLINKRAEQYKNFKIVAVRPKIKEDRINDQDKQVHLKNLKEGQVYQFYSAYTFVDDKDKVIEYDPSQDPEIYNYNDLNISISAIVGMNGSGKSTIADFIYLIINRISKEKKIKSTHKLINEEVYADLYIKSDQFYKISVGKKVEVFIYDFNKAESKYYKETKDSDGKKVFKKFDVESLCYSLVVNYSQYGLNSKIAGRWVNPLFHKNDSYQVPIVFNPKRNNGDIDIDIESKLAKSRLLHNLLEPRLIKFESKAVPALVPGSVPEKLMLELDRKKLEGKRKRYKNIIDKTKIEIVIKELNINIRANAEFVEEAKEYIYLKIIGIAYTYSTYVGYKKLPEWINDKGRLTNYISRLLEDPSHITFKLKQAINYLIYDLYNTNDENRIIDLSQNILNYQNGSGERELRTIDMLPPSFLKTNVIFKHGGSFDLLSSGEKQQIYSINTIAYHLYNLKSVKVYEDVYKYNSVNIIFDEVELYFHPDMQRRYINNLRDRILTLDLNKDKDINNINNINIIFITHSPFILSDIPKSNILMLKLNENTNESLPCDNNEETFGANVHDLLANDFFMENGFMGEFAKYKIEQAILYLNYVNIKNKYQDNEKLKKEKKNNVDSNESERMVSELLEIIQVINNGYNDRLKLEEYIEMIEVKPLEIKTLIETIGEQVIRTKLLDMYNELFAHENDEEAIRGKIKEMGSKIGYNVELIKKV